MPMNTIRPASRESMHLRTIKFCWSLSTSIWKEEGRRRIPVGFQFTSKTVQRPWLLSSLRICYILVSAFERLPTSSETGEEGKSRALNISGCKLKKGRTNDHTNYCISRGSVIGLHRHGFLHERTLYTSLPVTCDYDNLTVIINSSTYLTPTIRSSTMNQILPKTRRIVDGFVQ